MRRKWLLTWLLCCAICTAWAEDAPLDILKRASSAVLHELTNQQSALQKDPQIIKRIVERHMVPHFEVTGMVRSVLGRDTWERASTVERARFTKAFKQLVINTYAAPLAQFDGERIKFLNPAATPQHARRRVIKTILLRKVAANVPVNYRFIHLPQGWKIYDVTIEGISLLQSYRSQFHNELRQGGLSQLIQRLEKHNRQSL